MVFKYSLVVLLCIDVHLRVNALSISRCFMKPLNKKKLLLLVFLVFLVMLMLVYKHGDIYYYISIAGISISYGLAIIISNKYKINNLKVVSMVLAIFGLGFIFKSYEVESFYLFLNGLFLFTLLSFMLDVLASHFKFNND